ncbi:MAG: hypothetical protein AAGM22_02865 [Acidobacteriota bacterium]
MSTVKSRLPGGKKRERLRQKIEVSRNEVAHALDVLRAGAHREFAFLPKGEKWLLPSVAFALGIALAGGSKKPSASSYRPLEDRDEAPPEPAPEATESSVEGEGAEDSASR